MNSRRTARFKLIARSTPFIAAGMMIASCGEGKFAGGSARSTTPIQKITIDGSDTKEIPTPFNIKNGELEIYFDPGNRSSEADSATKRPLTVYFAIDVTGSMTPVINAIKNNINQFVVTLTTKGYEPAIGAVAFRDNISETFSLSDNIPMFSAFISRLTATGGGDYSEASLAAVEEITRRINSEDKRANSLKTILAITDNPGHRGGEIENLRPRTNCGVAETVMALNSMPKENQRNYRLYHSMAPAGSVGIATCGGFRSGREQFNTILNQIFPEVPIEQRGSELNWPFTGETLLNDFVGKLEEIKPGRELVCLAQSAKLEVNGKIISNWQGPKFTDTYRSFTGGKALKLANIVKNEGVHEIEKDGGKLKVKRCCFLKSEADAGNFGACASEVEQVVDFKVTVK